MADVRSVILSPPAPYENWDSCFLELDASRWRSIRRSRTENEFTAALDALNELHPKKSPPPRLVLADIPIETLFTRDYLSACWLERRSIFQALKSLNSSLSYALSIDPLPTILLLLLTSTLLTTSFIQDTLQTFLLLPTVVAPLIGVYFNVLIWPRDRNMARNVVREVDQLTEEGEKGVNIALVVGGNHVEGIREELIRLDQEGLREGKGKGKEELEVENRGSREGSKTREEDATDTAQNFVTPRRVFFLGGVSAVVAAQLFPATQQPKPMPREDIVEILEMPKLTPAEAAVGLVFRPTSRGRR